MRALFVLLSLRYLRAQPLRAWLALCCIALGVALYVSLEAAHETATHAFESSRRALAGDARWRVTRGRGLGVDTDVLQIIEALPGARAAPVLELALALPYDPDHPQARRVLVRGIDPLREARLRGLENAAGSAAGLDAETLARLALASAVPLPGKSPSALITPELAASLDLAAGQTFEVSTPRGLRNIGVAGVLALPGAAEALAGSVAFVSLHEAQRMFGRPGQADHVDVAWHVPEAGQRLAAELGPSYRVEPIVESGEKVFDDMIANLRALVFLSVIGLLAGLFIIYQVVSIAVVERAKAIGTARALGATRGQVVGTFLAEAGLLGLAGAILGVVLGRLFAWSSLEVVGRLANLYVQVVEIETVVLPAHVVLSGIGLGVGTALLAAFVPARRAASLAPALVLRPGQRSAPVEGRGRVTAAIGLTLLVLAIGCALWPPLPSSILWAGYAPAIALFLGTALVLPRGAGLVAWCLRPALLRWTGVPGLVALDGILRQPQRAALTAVALAGALGLYVTAATQTASARTATDTWVRRAFPFDLTVGPVRSGGLYGRHTLEAELVHAVRETPGVALAYGVRLHIQEYADADVLLFAPDLARYRDLLEERGEDLLGGMDAAAERALVSGEAAAVSRNFALLHGTGAGEVLALRSPSGTVRLPIVHVFDDYSWPKGAVVLERELYARRWQDPSLSQVDLVLADGARRDDVVSALFDALEQRADVAILTGDDVRTIASWAVEQAYSIVNAQVIVALLVGLLGTVSTVLISVLGRRRELALLRVVGLTRRQTARAVAIEAVLLAFAGAVVGILAGIFCAAFPAANLLRLMTGYVLPTTIPWGPLVAVLLAASLVGLVASILPARQAARTDLLEAIGYE